MPATRPFSPATTRRGVPVRILAALRARVCPARTLTVLALTGALLGAGASAAQATEYVGANMHPLSSDSGNSVILQEFSDLQAAHANSVRIDLPWQTLEGTQGVYDPGTISQMDWIMSEAAAHGLKVILVFWESPCWASSAPASLSQGCSSGWWNRGVGDYAPVNPQAYATAAAWVAQRWGSEMAALEVWNEPNGGQYFLSPTPVANYAALLKATYPAVKAVAPNLPVLLTLAGTDKAWLDYLYVDGARGYYDGIALHPYNDLNFVGLQALRVLEVANGDNSPIWATEFGWPSTAVGLQTQANDIGTALTQLSQLPYVVASEVYNLRDVGTDPTNNEDNFGMLYNNLSPKPSWTTFTQIVPTVVNQPPSQPAPLSGSVATVVPTASTSATPSAATTAAPASTTTATATIATTSTPAVSTTTKTPTKAPAPTHSASKAGAVAHAAATFAPKRSVKRVRHAKRPKRRARHARRASRRA